MDQLINILDLRTIMLVSCIIYAICAMQVVVLWHQNRGRFQGIGYLALNYGLQTLALLALVVRGLIPESVSIYLTNGLIAFGVILGYYGFTVFCGKPQRMFMWGFLYCAYMLGIIYWYSVAPSLMWRVINNSTVLMVTGFLTGYFLLRETREPFRGFVWHVGWLHILYALFFGARALISVFEHRDRAGFFDDKTYEAVLGIFYPAMFVLLTYAVGLMINRRLVWETEKAQAQLKTLSGLLPICSHCKKVRDDRGYWNQIESYISMHSEADFSHGICPECEKSHYPDINRAKS